MEDDQAADEQHEHPDDTTHAESTGMETLTIPFPQQPDVIYTVQHEYTCLPCSCTPCPLGNFLKGVKWSPDGACLLTASEDGWMRVYDLPQDCMSSSAPPLYLNSSEQTGEAQLPPWDLNQPDSLGAALRIQEGELIYDSAWYSCMNAADPVSCCFATTSRAHPVHLWDAMSGDLRATYRGFNDVDEVTAAFSLAFSPDGTKLYAGYSKWILAFDVARPGRESRKISCSVKGPGKYSARLPGMVSSMAFTPDGSGLAVGTYAGSIGIFDPRVPEMQLVLQGHKGGITQLQYTNDGMCLLSGARQDADLLCWDLRVSAGGEVLHRMQRCTASTNQRIGFSLEPCGRHVATGGQDGCVRVFDLQTGQRVDDMAVASDTINGCDFHPSLALLAVSTGEREFKQETDYSPPSSPAGLTGQCGMEVQADAAQGIKNALRVLRLQHDVVVLS